MTSFLRCLCISAAWWLALGHCGWHLWLGHVVGRSTLVVPRVSTCIDHITSRVLNKGQSCRGHGSCVSHVRRFWQHGEQRTATLRCACNDPLPSHWCMEYTQLRGLLDCSHTSWTCLEEWVVGDLWLWETKNKTCINMSSLGRQQTKHPHLSITSDRVDHILPPSPSKYQTLPRFWHSNGAHQHMLVETSENIQCLMLFKILAGFMSFYDISFCICIYMHIYIYIYLIIHIYKHIRYIRINMHYLYILCFLQLFLAFWGLLP